LKLNPRIKPEWEPARMLARQFWWQTGKMERFKRPPYPDEWKEIFRGLISELGEDFLWGLMGFLQEDGWWTDCLVKHADPCEYLAKVLREDKSNSLKHKFEKSRAIQSKIATPSSSLGISPEAHDARPASDVEETRWPFAFFTWSEDVTDGTGTVPFSDIRIAIHYHFNPRREPADLFYRERGLSKETLEHFARKMVESVPAGYDPKSHPWDPWKRTPDPSCPKCHGGGGREAKLLGTKASNFVMCRCIDGPAEADMSCPKCRGGGGKDVIVKGHDQTVWVPCDCLDRRPKPPSPTPKTPSPEESSPSQIPRIQEPNMQPPHDHA